MQTATVAGGIAGGVLGAVLGFALGRPFMHPALGAALGAAVLGTAGGLIGSAEAAPPPQSTVTLAPGAQATTLTSTGGTATFMLPTGGKWQSLKGAGTPGGVSQLGAELAGNVIGTNTALAVTLTIGSPAVFNATWTDASGASQTTILTVTATS